MGHRHHLADHDDRGRLHLLEIEQDLNDLRIAGAADYSVARHVEVMISLMGEARLLRALTRAA